MLCSAVLSRLPCVQLSATLWTIAHQAPLSMGSSRHEYWSGLPCPPPEALPHSGIEPLSFLYLLHWQAVSLTLAPPGKPLDQFSSVYQSYPTLCNPRDCSTPGFPVHHHPLKPTQTHVHPVGDAIQPSYPLSSPFPPAFNLSQHQGLFQ